MKMWSVGIKRIQVLEIIMFLDHINCCLCLKKILDFRLDWWYMNLNKNQRFFFKNETLKPLSNLNTYLFSLQFSKMWWLIIWWTFGSWRIVLSIKDDSFQVKTMHAFKNHRLNFVLSETTQKWILGKKSNNLFVR